MKMRLREWIKSFLEKEQVNRRYAITEQRDGRWVCQAFTPDNQKIAEIVINTPQETWRVLMLLSGYSWDNQTDDINERINKSLAA